MRQPLLWFLLGAIAIALIVLVTHHDDGMIGPLSTGDFAALSYRLVLLVFIAPVVVVMFRGRFTQAITAALLWIAIPSNRKEWLAAPSRSMTRRKLWAQR